MHKKLLNKILPIALSVAMTVQMTPETVLASEYDDNQVADQPVALNEDENISELSDTTKKTFDCYTNEEFVKVTAVTGVENGVVSGSAITISTQTTNPKYEVSEVTVSGIKKDKETNATVTWSRDAEKNAAEDLFTVNPNNPEETVSIPTASIGGDIVVDIKATPKLTGAITLKGVNVVSDVRTKKDSSRKEIQVAEVTEPLRFELENGLSMLKTDDDSVKCTIGETTYTVGTDEDDIKDLGEGTYEIPADLLTADANISISASYEREIRFFGSRYTVSGIDLTASSFTDQDGVHPKYTQDFITASGAGIVTFKLHAARNKEIDTVTMVINGVESILEKDSDDTYTIPKETDLKKLADVDIIVQTKADTITVKYDTDGGLYAIKDKTVNKEEDHGCYLPLKPGYKVDRVTVSGSAIFADLSDDIDDDANAIGIPARYSTSDITVTITSKKDISVSWPKKDPDGKGVEWDVYGCDRNGNIASQINNNTMTLYTGKTNKIYIKKDSIKADGGNPNLVPTLNGKDADSVDDTYYVFKVDEKANSLVFGYGESQKAENYSVTESLGNAKITYKNLCVRTDGTGKVVNKGDDIVFSVTPEKDYEVTNVSYTIGAGTTSVDLVASNGEYKIPAAKISGTVNISVQTAEIGKESNTVSFDIPTGFKVKVGNEVITTSTSKTVKAGESISFTVVEPENVELGFVGTNKNKNSAIRATNGSYTFKPTHDTTLYVVEKAKFKTDIDSKQAPGTASIPLGITYDNGKTLDDNTEIYEGTTVNFKIAKPTAPYAIKKVTFGTNTDGTKNPAISIDSEGNGKYTVVEGGKLTIFTGLDEKATGVKKLSYTVSGGKAKVVYSPSSEEIESGFLTTNDKVQLTIEPELAGYKIKSVKCAKEEAIEVADTADGNGKTVTVTYGDSNALSLQIEVECKATEDRVRGITFRNDASAYFTVDVDKASADPDEDNKDQYIIRTGVRTFDFTVKSKNGKVPEATYKGVIYQGTGSGSTYKFSIPASLFDDYTTIGISEKVVSSAFRLYDDGNVTYKVKINGTEETPTDFYRLKAGDKVSVTVTAKGNHVVSNIAKKVGDVTTTTAPNAQEYVIEYVADGKSVSYNIETKAIKGIVINESINEYFADNGVFKDLELGKTYTARVMIGDQEDSTVGDAKLVSNGTLDSEFNYSLGLATFKLSEADSGETLTLTFYSKAEEGKEAQVIGTAQIKVPTLMKSVIINKGQSATLVPGQSKDLNVVLPEGTTLAGQDIVIGTTDSDFDTELIYVNKNEQVVDKLDADARVGKLRVKAPVKAGTAIITLYRGSETPENALGSVEVISDTSQVTNASVSIEQLSATDSELYIGIKAPANLPDKSKVDCVYAYEVSYTSENNSEMIEGPLYFDYNPSGYAKVLAKVETVDPTNDQAHTYNVSVKLVQMKSNTLSKDNILAESSASSEVTMKTRALYYEDSLKVKNNAKVVYTGQNLKDAIVPLFSENASFTTVTAEDLTQPTGGLGFVYDDEETKVSRGSIGITVPSLYSGLKTGVHKVKITSYAEEGLLASSTIVDVKVVRGIEAIALNAPDQVYRPAKKNVTVQLSHTLNYGINKYKPQKPDVTYEVTEINGQPNGSVTYDKYISYVSVNKNGKLIINKGADKDLKTIKVTAKAADYEGTSIKDSEIIGISAEALEMGSLVITNANGDVIVGTNKASVSATDLDGAYIKVTKGDVKTKDLYDINNDFIASGNLKLISNNPDIEIMSNGLIEVKKVTKDMKFAITAKTLDGSKQVKKLSGITVKFAEAKKPTIWIWSMDDSDRADSSITNQKNDTTYSDEITYSANGSRKFSLKFLNDTTNVYYARPNVNYYGYKISVQNADVVSRDPNNNNPTQIVVNGKSAKVFLTDLRTGKKVATYVLKNESLSEKKAPKITVKGTLTAGDVTNAVANTYNRTITVKANTNAKKAFVKVNHTAMQAAYDKTTNHNRYDGFVRQITDLDSGIIVDVENGEFTLPFGDGQIDAGVYKLQVTYGNEVRDDGTLVAQYKTANINVKAVAPQKAVVQLNQKYKMSLADATSVKLTYAKKSKGVGAVTYTSVLNANVSGKPNEFNKLFTVSNDGILSFVGTAEDVQKLIVNPDNLTGYVEYDVTDLNGNKERQTQQIKISIVESAGVYKSSSIVVAKGMTEASSKILFNNKAISLKSVEIDSAKGITAKLDEDGKTILLSNIPEKIGNYKVTFTVAPEDTLVPGTTVTVKAVVKVTDGKNAGKLVFKESDLSIDMSALNPHSSKANNEKLYYVPTEGKGQTGYYVATVPYTLQTVVDISKMSIVSSNKSVVVENDAENSQLLVKVYRSSVTNATSKLRLNTNLKISFDGTKMKKENVSLSVRFPEAVNSFSDIVSKGNAAIDKLQLKARNTLEAQNEIIKAFANATGFEPYALTVAKDENQSIATFTSTDSEMSVSLIATKDFIVPNSMKDGAAFIKVVYTNNAEASDSDNRTVTYKKNLKVAHGAPSTNQTPLLRLYHYDTASNGANKAYKVTNNTTATDIVNDLTTYLKLTGGDRLKVSEITVKPASDAADGKILFYAQVVDKYGKIKEVSDERYAEWIDTEIPKLQAVSDVKTALINGKDNVICKPTETAVKAWIAETIKKAATTNSNDFLNADIKYSYNKLEETQENGTKVKKDVIISPDKTNAKVELSIWNPNSKVDRDKVETVKLTISFVTVPNVNDVVTKLQTDLRDILNGTSITVGTTNKTPVQLNTKDAFVQAIDNSIKGAVKNSDITVTKTVEFTAAQYDGKYVNSTTISGDAAMGKLKVVYTITSGDTKHYVYTNGSSTLVATSESAPGASAKETKFASNAENQTADMLVNDIKCAIKDATKSDVSLHKRGLTANEAIGKISNILTTVKKNTTDNNNDTKLAAWIATKEFTNDLDITVKAPTANTEGRITVSIVVKETVNGKVKLIPVKIDYAIAKVSDAATVTDKANDVKVALDKYIAGLSSVTQANAEDTTWLNRVKAQIVEEAKNVGVVVTTENVALTIAPYATPEQEGKLRVTVTVGSDSTTAVGDITIEKLSKLTMAQAETKITDFMSAELKNKYDTAHTVTSTDVARLCGNERITSKLGKDYTLKPVDTWDKGKLDVKAPTASAEGSIKVTVVLKQNSTGARKKIDISVKLPKTTTSTTP